MSISINQKLALLAFALSLMALITSTFFPDNSFSENTSGLNYISVLDLAESIKNRKSLVLIDLRSKEEFDQFHIPTARNLKTPDLLHSDFNPDANLVLYSERDSLSKQAFLTLKEKSFNEVKILRGGVQDWYSRLLYPRMPKVIPSEDKELADRVKVLTEYFGGRSEFVNEGNPLDYYRDNTSNHPVIQSRLVRMGC
ncbi:MAG: rhodanese-like domain-containing protein [Balneola sp.]